MRLNSTFPKTIDINPTAKCNLHCSFCWGPDHRLPDALSTQDWLNLISFFQERGTTAVVFTGGEPLLCRDLPVIMRFAKSLGLTTTLSTNGLLLARRMHEVLPWCDEIGLPIDGSTKELNSKMRLGTTRAFSAALRALELVREWGSGIETTVRTVVSKVNSDDVMHIGSLLDERKGLIDRWKVYQFAPASIGSLNRADHDFDDDAFEKLGASLEKSFGHLSLCLYPSRKRHGRYVFVGPTGEIYGIGPNKDYVEVANFATSTVADCEAGIKALVDFSTNSQHG